MYCLWAYSRRQCCCRESAEVSGDEVVLNYIMPVLPDNLTIEKDAVLPTVQYGGPKVTFAKPIDTFFELSINSAPSPFGEQNFEHR